MRPASVSSWHHNHWETSRALWIIEHGQRGLQGLPLVCGHPHPSPACCSARHSIHSLHLPAKSRPPNGSPILSPMLAWGSLVSPAAMRSLESISVMGTGNSLNMNCSYRRGLVGFGFGLSCKHHTHASVSCIQLSLCSTDSLQSGQENIQTRHHSAVKNKKIASSSVQKSSPVERSASCLSAQLSTSPQLPRTLPGTNTAGQVEARAVATLSHVCWSSHKPGYNKQWYHCVRCPEPLILPTYARWCPVCSTGQDPSFIGSERHFKSVF